MLFTSCKTGPSNQVDKGKVIENKNHSDEIGWTIEIAKGWNVIKREESQDRENRGLKAVSEWN